MKKLLLFLSFLLVTKIYAQTTNEGEPFSWSLIQEKSSLKTITLSKINIKKTRTEDIANDKLKAKPWRYGLLRKLDYSLDNSGLWTELDNGDRIWRISLKSPDAINVSINFNKFNLPEGSSIYLYNSDRSDLVGAYTDLVNNKNKMLGTWFVKGDNVTIEYYEPKEVKGLAQLNIGSLIHGYRLGKEYQKKYYNHDLKINESGDCNQDVDCPIGNDFENKKNILKKSVAFLRMGNGFICSGALVNNTNNDKKPYFLTADHCFTDSDGNPSNPALYSMRFNWISPNPVCASTTNSTESITNFTMNGSVLRAKNSKSDFMLVELNNQIPSNWDVVYAGWDKTDTNPSYEVGIHHPSGDIMKVCRDNDGAVKDVSLGDTQLVDIWRIAASDGGWEIGVTEGGSSGSPLFNENGHIIGQLFAGQAACSGINDNDEFDVYGRFATSWNAGTNSSTRLKDWLDSGNLDPDTLDDLKNVLSANDKVLEENVSVFPNPTSDFLTIKIVNNISELKYELFNLLGQNLKSGTVRNNEPINLGSLANAVYLVKITDVERNASLTKKIVISK